ncbi:hypothetical protein K501DRAFT_174516 [Backusella circina FSU 941]|nr:hypothetical protein K501DRAFT_174516 [Backusella circina FSU 941]
MDHSHHNMVSSASSAIASMTMSAITSATPSAAAHDMSNMDMSDSSSGSSMNMMSTMGAFHWSSSGDAIWLESWVPQTEGAYIGACFGLFFVSILSRSLPAMESYFVAWRAQKNNNVLLDSNGPLLDKKDVRCDLEKSSNVDTSSSQSFNPAQYPQALRLPSIPAFSWRTDTIRSFLTTLTSFVSYLLMMVVMTGNGGFFLVIVIGVFVGEMAFGRFRSLGGGWQGGEHNH